MASFGQGVVGLGVANGVAVLCSVVAAAVYALWLSPTALAHWATALALARAGTLLLDGGLKTALVRREQWPQATALRRLRRVNLLVAKLLAGGVALAVLLLLHAGRLAGAEALLFVVYPAAYLSCQSGSFVDLARLERAGRFGAIGRAEGVSTTLEFVLPALLLQSGMSYSTAFALAVAFARVLRASWIRRAALEESAAWTTRAVPARMAAASLWKEGLAVQGVAALSMLRDQAHLWMLAPWFGATWAGSYTLALTACAIGSQVAVQTLARVAMPMLRATAPRRRPALMLARTRRLAIATLPPLALLPAWLAWANAAWWGGHWSQAIPLVPWFALRMVAGVATTTVGAWLIVERAPAAALRAHFWWTAAEVALAATALSALGAVGLAVAGAFSAWIGVAALLMATVGRSAWGCSMRRLLSVLWLRPSLWCAVVAGSAAVLRPNLLAWASAGLLAAWCSEPMVRCWLRRQLGWLAHIGRRSTVVATGKAAPTGARHV